MFRFERLQVWQESLNLVDQVYRATRTFPENERFGPVSQLRRAAVSVSSNIAEGSARTDPDFCKFVTFAAGSVYELVTQIHIARRQGFLDEKIRTEIIESAERVSRMLSGLRASLGGGPLS